MEVRTIAGSSNGWTDDYGTAASFSIDYSGGWGVGFGVLDPPTHKTLYLTDSGNGLIRTLDTVSLKTTTLVGGNNPGHYNTGASNGVGTNARFNGAWGIAIDAAGAVLYVSDRYGATLREVTISNTTVRTIAGPGVGSGSADIQSRARSRDAVGTNAVFQNPTGLFLDGDSLFVADESYCDVRSYSLSTGMVTLIAGSGGVTPLLPNCGGLGLGHLYADGVGTNAYFFQPQGLCGDGAGKLYVTDLANNLIRTINIATRMVSTLAGGGASGAGFPHSGCSVGGVGTALFSGPYGLTMDLFHPGFLIVTDMSCGLLRRVNVASGEVSHVAGPLTLIDSSHSVDGFGPAARFGSPIGVALSRYYFTYVVDENTGKVRVITSSEFGASNTPSPTQTPTASNTPTPSSTPGSNNVNVLVGDNYGLSCWVGDGIGTSAHFGTSCSGTPQTLLATHLVGNELFIAETSMHSIRKMNMTTLNVTSLAGCVATWKTAWPLVDQPPNCQGTTDGVGSNAKFFRVYGLAAVDGPPATTLLISDNGNDLIRKMDLATNNVTTIVSRYQHLAGSNGAGVYVSDVCNDGIGTNAMTFAPMGMASDLAGSVYFVDGTKRVRVISTTSFPYTVTSIAGRMPRSFQTRNAPNNEVAWNWRACGGDFDGVGTNAIFGSLNGIAHDGTGRTLFVADNGNGASCFRRVDIATGAVRTIVGYTSGPPGSIFLNGGASIAKLAFPTTTQAYADSYGNVSNFFAQPPATRNTCRCAIFF